MTKTGVVYKMMEEKNFGFIQVEGEKEDYFFHRDECICDFYTLDCGTRVEFDPITSIKGPRAIAVDLAERKGPDGYSGDH